jgi:small subunit ribosomal protein S6
MNINAPVSALNEVERQISLNENILRHLTIKVDEFNDGPSVMMEHKNHDSKE